ncbi:MAG: ABC transporter permease [Caulobacteraceae bacterium]
MIRLLRIARREYLAYVRTPGFWLSLLLLPVGLSTMGVARAVLNKTTPPLRIAVIDFSNQGMAKVVTAALAAPNADPKTIIVPAPSGPFANPADAEARLQPYLRGQSVLPGGARLDTAVILRPAGDTVAIDYWSRNINEDGLEGLVSGAVQTAIRRDRLRTLGVEPQALARVENLSPEVSVFSPKAATGKVSFRDRLPQLAALAMGMLLWMVVLTGAGMLLNSVMEEKTSRIIEVLLSSASVPEIMGGKILGVACVTGTILAFWMTISGILIFTLGSPSIAGEVLDVFLSHGRWAYFALYLGGGYMMFATLYVTIGAFCETAREAQTLLGPMMIIMSIPLVYMILSIGRPDAPLLRTLTWVPLFTPFMMAARAANDPPIWEILATGAMMAAVTALELWVAVPAFKAGALATGRFDTRVFFARLTGRAAQA